MFMYKMIISTNFSICEEISDMFSIFICWINCIMVFSSSVNGFTSTEGKIKPSSRNLPFCPVSTWGTLKILHANYILGLKGIGKPYRVISLWYVYWKENMFYWLHSTCWNYQILPLWTNKLRNSIFHISRCKRNRVFDMMWKENSQWHQSFSDWVELMTLQRKGKETKLGCIKQFFII